jgi:hypothetical protein
MRIEKSQWGGDRFLEKAALVPLDLNVS